jgi:glycosyltransferase involved in cell wall biosynthesis
MTEQNGACNEIVLVTFFLITNNQEKYIRNALEGAFIQTYSPLEIVVSDDCSTDRTFQIIEDICSSYCGPHRIVVNRNPRNLGLIDHINRITSLSSGELIVYASGDDISFPERTEKLVARYLASGRKASLIHSSVILMSNAGRVLERRAPPPVSLSSDIAAIALSSALIIGATSAFTRKLEETFGAIKHRKCIEDLVMGFRSALPGGLVYIDEPLVLYRHQCGMTATPDIRNLTYADLVKREIHNQEIYLDVLAQRGDDLRMTRHDELHLLIREKRSEVLLNKVVWVQRNLSMTVYYAYKTDRLKMVARVFFRKQKKRFTFPVKKFISRLVLES